MVRGPRLLRATVGDGSEVVLGFVVSVATIIDTEASDGKVHENSGHTWSLGESTTRWIPEVYAPYVSSSHYPYVQHSAATDILSNITQEPVPRNSAQQPALSNPAGSWRCTETMAATFTGIFHVDFRCCAHILVQDNVLVCCLYDLVVGLWPERRTRGARW